MENFRRDPKEYAPFMNSATRILAFGPYTTTNSPESKKELTEMLHRLWNIDGVPVNMEMEEALISGNWETAYIKAAIGVSGHEGNAYMDQIIKFLDNLKNK